MEGIFIPKEFYKVKELNGMERDVLAIYKYYTENGKYKCCSLTSTQIADELNVSTRYLRMVKKHLKDLGYIRTDGGIKVIYLGINKDESQDTKVGSTVPPQEEAQFLQVGSTVPIGRKYSSYQVGSTVPIEEEVQFLHKKEKKEKKIKKEKKGMEKIDLIIDNLPEGYKTAEKIEVLKKDDMYMERINSIDILDSSTLPSCIFGAKQVIDKVFPQEYHIEKKEPEIKTFDITDFL